MVSSFQDLFKKISNYDFSKQVKSSLSHLQWNILFFPYTEQELQASVQTNSE